MDNSGYQKALEWILQRPRFSRRPGLDRMRRLMERLGNPQETVKFAHIAGTNGKGSTAVMLAGVFQEAGMKTGVFLSPHILDYRERVQINGEWIPQEAFAALAEELHEAADVLEREGEPPLQFEIITALAFCWFARRQCDIVCLETGIGGRMDSTNIIKTPLISVICQIGLDHMEILGDTIEKIAAEKAGIIKEGGLAAVYPDLEPEALAAVMERCAQFNATMILGTLPRVKIVKQDLSGTEFIYGGEEYRIGMPGVFQVSNAVNVIEAVNALAARGLPMEQKHLRLGLERASIKARAEVFRTKPLIVLDGAHNLSGVHALEQVIPLMDERQKDRLVCVVGMLADKSYQEEAASLARYCRYVIAVPVDNPRTASPWDVAKAAGGQCPAVMVCRDLEYALETAERLAGEDGAVLICGSLYLASQMRKIIVDRTGLDRPGQK